MKCCMCEQECQSGFDARELYDLVGLIGPDDGDPYNICMTCYNKVEHAIATTFLKKVMEEK